MFGSRIQAAIVFDNPLFTLFHIEKPKFHTLSLTQNRSRQPRVTNEQNFNGPESTMLNIKFCGNRSTGSGEKDV